MLIIQCSSFRTAFETHSEAKTGSDYNDRSRYEYDYVTTLLHAPKWLLVSFHMQLEGAGYHLQRASWI